MLASRTAPGHYDAHADSQDDDAENVVYDCSGHDGDAFLGVHLVPFGQDARRDSDGRGRGHDTHEHRGRRKHGLHGGHLSKIAERPRQELRQQAYGADVAKQEARHDAADADH